MLRLRTAGDGDLQFLRAMLVEAAYWRPDAIRPPFPDPQLARYVEGFGRPGDLGVVADQDAEPVGAAWWRYFSAAAPGYGFIDEATPEISIGVLPAHRGHGIGTALLGALLREARDRQIGRLSLSVERDNPAAALYERLGFRALHRDGSAVTMALDAPDS
jgi:GNAT superfamily N-acetyltransferase